MAAEFVLLPPSLGRLERINFVIFENIGRRLPPGKMAQTTI